MFIFRGVPSGAVVQQRSDRCFFQVLTPQHLLRPLFFLQSRRGCHSLWVLQDCQSHLPKSHLRDFLWGIAPNCWRTTRTSDPDLQVTISSDFIGRSVGENFFFSWLMVVSCPIRGCVVGPTFHFDVLELNFGDVAFGGLDFFCFAFYMSHCNTVWHHKESQRISISTVVQLWLKNLNYYFF